MVEQIPVKDKVKGSNPFAGAKLPRRTLRISPTGGASWHLIYIYRLGGDSKWN